MSDPTTEPPAHGFPLFSPFLTTMKAVLFLAWVFCLVGGLSQQAAAQASPEAAAAYTSAAALQDQGLYDLATKEWLALVEAHPEDPLVARAHYNLGVCHFQSGNFEAAARQFEKAAGAKGAEPIVDSALANLGLARFNLAASAPADGSSQAAYRSAIAAFDKLLKDHPQSTQAGTSQFYQGEAYTALGDARRAAECYMAALADQNAAALHPATRLSLAAAQLDLNQPQPAEETLNTLLATSPQGDNAAEAYRLRGEARLALRQYRPAAQDFERATHSPGYAAAADAMERQAFSLYGAGAYAEAAQVYQSLPRRFPESPLLADTQLAAGKCLVLAGKTQEAAILLDAIWRTQPTQANAEAAHWLVQTLLKSKEYGQVAQVAQQALDTRPEERWSAALQMALADALFETPNRRQDSLGVYRGLARQQGRSALGQQASYLAAHTAMELKDHALALQLAGDFLRAFPDHQLATEARLIAAEAAAQVGQDQDAIARYRQLLDTVPRDSRASDWTLRLASLLRKQQDWNGVAQLLDSRLDTLQGAAHDRALMILAEAHRQVGDAQSATADLTRLIQHGRDKNRTARALYQRGELRNKAGDPQGANQDFVQLVRSYPKHDLAPYAMYAVASNQIAADQLAPAESTLRKLLASYTQGPVGKARYLLASVLQQRGQYDEVLTLLDQAEAPADQKLYLRGMSLAGGGENQQAIVVFEQLLREHKQHELTDRVLFELAWANRQTNAARAVQYFQQLVKEHPQSELVGESYLRAGELLYEKKDYPAAVAALSRVEQTSVTAELKAQASHLLGWAHFEQEEHEAALRAFRQQLAAAPRGKLAADGAVMIGECLFAQEQHESALAAYQPTADSPPQSRDLAALAWLHAGQSAAQLGEWEESLAWVDRAREEDEAGSHRDQLIYERGWALFNLNRGAEARPLFEQLAKTKRGVLAARSEFMIGELQFAEKEFEPAVRTFFRVAYGYGGRDAPEPYHTWQSESLFEAARCLEQLDRIDAAKKLYVELLERFPDSAKARHARARLQSGVLR